METQQNWEEILSLLPVPAFVVEGDRIRCANVRAGALLLAEGAAVLPLLASGDAEYRSFDQGCLCLSLKVGSKTRLASVHNVYGQKVFLLDAEEEELGLDMLGLAAQNLRGPLADVMAAADALLPALSGWEDPALYRQLAQMNRGMYQLLRIVSNMSDAGAYLQGGKILAPEETELCGFFRELFQKAGTLASVRGIKIGLQCPPDPVYGQIDRQKMERAVYNLLSNALKVTPQDGTVLGTLQCQGGMMILSVTDFGGGENRLVDPFTGYRRASAVDDGRRGLGLGLPIARQVAALHGGALLLQQRPDGLRVALSARLSRGDGDRLASPRMQPDYAGCRDHCLVELSPVLPSEVFGVD